MMKKRITNMVLDIIYGVIAISLIALIIIFQALKGSILTIVFSSIVFSIIIGYFVISSIYYATSECACKMAFERIRKCFKVLIALLVISLINLRLDFYCKWILFSLVCLIGVLNITFKGIDRFDKIGTILDVLLLCGFILGVCLLFGNSYLLYMAVVLGCVFFSISLIDNWVLDIFECVPLILLGIFLIFI